MMKSIIRNTATVIIAFIGLVGGLIWAFKTNWDLEPLILIAVSSIEMIVYIVIRAYEDFERDKSNNLSLQAKFDSNEKEKAKTRILFIDDNVTDFKMVSILKKSGWINTKLVKDITDLNDPKVVEADVIFVDINGVGTTMFQDQGLGLASALKKKHRDKKVVLYSAESTGDRFHKALREVDNCLSKNAEPYQFIDLIESFQNKE